MDLNARGWVEWVGGGGGVGANAEPIQTSQRLPAAGRSSAGLHVACIGKHLRRVTKILLIRMLLRRPLERALPNAPDGVPI